VSARKYYDHKNITIYHGDCREVLPTIEADALISDPPYGVNYSSGWDNEFQNVQIANDGDISVRDAVLQIWGARPAIVFGSWKKPKPQGTMAVLVWDKGTVGMGDLSIPWFPCTEEIYVLGSGWVGTRTSAVMRHIANNQYHPTEKPLGLMRELCGKCNPQWRILDPFMGSGTTLRAAKDLGLKAIGIEIEEKYCEIAARRLEQEVFEFN
jgi:DNA modification methylase